MRPTDAARPASPLLSPRAKIPSSSHRRATLLEAARTESIGDAEIPGYPGPPRLHPHVARIWPCAPEGDERSNVAERFCADAALRTSRRTKVGHPLEDFVSAHRPSRTLPVARATEIPRSRARSHCGAEQFDARSTAFAMLDAERSALTHRGIAVLSRWRVRRAPFLLGSTLTGVLMLITIAVSAWLLPTHHALTGVRARRSSRDRLVARTGALREYAVTRAPRPRRRVLCSGAPTLIIVAGRERIPERSSRLREAFLRCSVGGASSCKSSRVSNRCRRMSRYEFGGRRSQPPLRRTRCQLGPLRSLSPACPPIGRDLIEQFKKRDRSTHGRVATPYWR